MELPIYLENKMSETGTFQFQTNLYWTYKI